jgi:hypothetical protein
MSQDTTQISRQLRILRVSVRSCRAYKRLGWMPWLGPANEYILRSRAQVCWNVRLIYDKALQAKRPTRGVNSVLSVTASPYVGELDVKWTASDHFVQLTKKSLPVLLMGPFLSGQPAAKAS